MDEAQIAEWRKRLWESEPRVYRASEHPAAVMPLGGLGTGTIGLHCDGSLRQWQIFNQVNHDCYVPGSVFAVRAQPEGSAAVTRLLVAEAGENPAEVEPAPLVTDHIYPDGLRDMCAAFGLDRVANTEMRGDYPIARIRYLDDALPVEVELEAFSPMIPLDDEASGLPAIVFVFHIRNPGDTPVDASVMATLQNAVGYDGVAAIDGVRCECYGGNATRVVRLDGWTAAEMFNEWLADDAPGQGTMVLACLADNVSACAGWTDEAELGERFTRTGRLSGPDAFGPTPQGETVNVALAAHVRVEPGQSVQVPFVIAWHFPNRYVNWSQGWFGIPDDGSKLFIGNWYATRWPSAMAVCEYIRDNFDRLVSGTREFRDALFDTTLPYWFIDAVAANMSTPRSPTCFRTADGNFYGFEGCCGGSTGCKLGGCCPLNCTHVWNYEFTLAKLYPQLERTMRDVDLMVQMNEAGGIPHRTVLPLWAPRWKDGGPGSQTIAADGHFGTVLKAYREWLTCGDRETLERWWPRIKKAMEYGFERWDKDGDGLLDPDEPQWNTYDLNFFGWNTFCSSYYLAALRAAEEMARLMGDQEFAAECRRRLDSGRTIVERELWNGEYYEQKVDLEKYPDLQYGTGCLSDQLIGQWWAHALALGPIVDPERDKAHLEAVFRYNWRWELAGHDQQPRKFANDDEKGLLVCTWPRGGRPKRPMLYCDEVWTGCEYRAAAHMIAVGLIEEAAIIVKGARERYDGRRRSPWNEIECGDHYARPMASWTMLEFAAGFFYSAPDRLMRIAPKVTPEQFRGFFVAGSAWGTISQQRDEQTLTAAVAPRAGQVEIARLELDVPETATLQRVALGGKEIAARLEDGVVVFDDPVSVTAEAALEVTVAL